MPAMPSPRRSLAGTSRKSVAKPDAESGPTADDDGPVVSLSTLKRQPTAKLNAVSREQQYWYAMEISPPTEAKKGGGVTVDAEGKFVLDNVPEEVRAMLAQIEHAKAAREAKASSAYEMEISAPTATRKTGGATVGADGSFVMDNVPEEMRAVLADIERTRRTSEVSAGAADPQ